MRMQEMSVQEKFLVIKVIFYYLLTVFYLNMNRTYQNFRSWISCADSRRRNGQRTGWHCWLHGYVKYPLLVRYQQQVWLNKYVNDLSKELHWFCKKKIAIHGGRCWQSVINLLNKWEKLTLGTVALGRTFKRTPNFFWS